MKSISCFVVGLATVWVGSAAADVLHATRAQPLVEVAHNVDVRIADGVATYKVRRQFANPGKVYGRLALGISVTAVLLTVIAKAGAPLWGASLIAGLVGGALQPYLFKDLRYR